MQNTSMQVILIDGKQLKAVRDNVASLVTFLNGQAKKAMELKRPQLGVQE